RKKLRKILFSYFKSMAQEYLDSLLFSFESLARQGGEEVRKWPKLAFQSQKVDIISVICGLSKAILG
ncbi:hypothetical protein DRN82_04410, partial [Thermococci archaeon]